MFNILKQRRKTWKSLMNTKFQSYLIMLKINEIKEVVDEQFQSFDLKLEKLVANDDFLVMD